MPHPNTLDSRNAVLAVIDIQEAFRDAIPEFTSVVMRTVTAIDGFQTLGLPVLITEQYPRGLGRTAEEILLSVDDGAEIFEKSTFSAFGSEQFAGRLAELGRSQIVLCGIETHVCVNQTAHDLIAAGYSVHLLTDAVGSRSEQDKLAGLEKMRLSGVVTSTVEMALFELMRDSKHEKFKEVQSLVK
ncbi:MAG: hydrolase [Pyrinomonadaceae bacterium]|nr:hydrolase [Pyrinomonadaceae bacterium]MBP6214089.1 hydrolase [Pyrinomonadaceae bacterium]